MSRCGAPDREIDAMPTSRDWLRIYDGSTQPPPTRTLLRAGMLTAAYENGMLRYIKAGAHEVVRGIYAAVRDHNWGTVPFTLVDEVIEDHGDSFKITFASIHRQDRIEYVWRGTISGSDDSSITFIFDGEAQSTFARNRIGLCVLHPADAAGAPLTVEHTDGAVEVGEFPNLIAPHQPFFDIRALTHTAAPGIRVEVRMDGDVFEMEDQRNWTDASFKTYCTPLARPFPVTVRPGDRVRQTVAVRLFADVPITAAQADAAVRVTLDLAHHENAIPRHGLCAAAHGQPLSERQIARLRAIQGDLRVDVSLDAADAHDTIRRAWHDGRLIGSHDLYIAVVVDPDSAAPQLEALSAFIGASQIAALILVLEKGAHVTSDAVFATARRAFAHLPSVRLMRGTNGYFTQINRQRPQDKDDFIVYSVNPQVHAFDNDSLIETLPMISETARTAREWVHRLGISPVTFKIRINPDATAPEAPTPPGHLPRQVDPRQMSLFGAGWTVGALASLIRARAEFITLYETIGWLGVMELEGGSPLPDLFPSIADAVYPLYHVMADLGACRAGWMFRCAVSDPLHASVLPICPPDDPSAIYIWIANHTDQTQTVIVHGLTGTWRGSMLDEHTAIFALREPETWRAQHPLTFTPGSDGAIRFELLPYALLRLLSTP